MVLHVVFGDMEAMHTTQWENKFRGTNSVSDHKSKYGHNLPFS